MNGLVYRKINKTTKFVVSEAMIINVIRAPYDNMAHCGPEKTLRGIEENFWFGKEFTNT